MAVACNQRGPERVSKVYALPRRRHRTGQTNGAARMGGPIPRPMIRSSPRQDLRRLLDTCGQPLALEEMARLLGVSERFVAYILMEATRSGRVGRLADGRYKTAMGRGGAPLTELLQFVAEC